MTTYAHITTDGTIGQVGRLPALWWDGTRWHDWRTDTPATNPADQHMLTFAATIAPISRALMFGNGMCLSLCDGLHNLGIRFGNPPVAVVAPQPRARSDEDNARVEIVAEATVAAAAAAVAAPTVEADDI